MTHFPLFTDLKDKNIIIFGGGAFALQRVNKLLPYQPRLTVISQSICDEIKAIDGITCCEREFCESDLDCFPVFAVIAEDIQKTQCVYKHCKERHIPVNAVDMPKYCDIIFPSIVSTEHLCIGISSGGLSPTATVEYKERIEKLIPNDIDSIIEWMVPIRQYINKTVEKDKRKGVLRALFNEALLKGRTLSDEEVENIKSIF